MMIQWNNVNKDKEFKALLYCLYVLKAIMLEKRKFSPKDSIESIAFMKEVLQICPELLFDNLDQAQPIQCVPL
jgi:hypothetical protein